MRVPPLHPSGAGRRRTLRAEVPQGQLGFINFVVKPLYCAIGGLAPDVLDTSLEDTIKSAA